MFSFFFWWHLPPPSGPFYENHCYSVGQCHLMDLLSMYCQLPFRLDAPGLLPFHGPLSFLLLSWLLLPPPHFPLPKLFRETLVMVLLGTQRYASQQGNVLLPLQSFCIRLVALLIASFQSTCCQSHLHRWKSFTSSMSLLDIKPRLEPTPLGLKALSLSQWQVLTSTNSHWLGVTNTTHSSLRSTPLIESSVELWVTNVQCMSGENTTLGRPGVYYKFLKMFGGKN